MTARFVSRWDYGRHNLTQRRTASHQGQCVLSTQLQTLTVQLHLYADHVNNYVSVLKLKNRAVALVSSPVVSSHIVHNP